MDRGAWWATGAGVAKNQTRLKRLSMHTTYRASQVSQWVRKKSVCNAGDAREVGSIPGLGRSPGGGNGNALQYSCLENFRGAWQATVHRLARESDTTEVTVRVPTCFEAEDSKWTSSRQTGSLRKRMGKDIKEAVRLHKASTCFSEYRRLRVCPGLNVCSEKTREDPTFYLWLIFRFCSSWK